MHNYSGGELLPSASPAHRAAVRCLLVCAPIYVAWGEGCPQRRLECLGSRMILSRSDCKGRRMTMEERLSVQHIHFMAMRGWTSDFQQFVKSRSQPKELEYQAMDKQTGHWCNSAYWKRIVPHLEDIVQDTFLGPTSGTYSLDSRWGDRRVHSVPTTGMTSFHKVEVQPEFDAEQSKNEIVKAV